mmetsp:Transcript_7178/g.18590  ORF Transcript_7178/g.18590 Transcript_7178/m.18590 type:complete len:222 (-) Transcript_7178:146-811(-)
MKLTFVLALACVLLASSVAQEIPIDDLANVQVEGILQLQLVTGGGDCSAASTDSCFASFAVFASSNTVWSVPTDLLQNQNQDCFKAVMVTTTAEASNNPSTWKMVADPSRTASVEFGASSLTTTMGECVYTLTAVKGTVGNLDSGTDFTAAETTALNGITSQVDNIKAALAAMHQGEGEGGEGEGEGNKGGDGGMGDMMSIIFIVVVVIIAIIAVVMSMFF